MNCVGCAVSTHTERERHISLPRMKSKVKWIKNMWHCTIIWWVRNGAMLFAIDKIGAVGKQRCVIIIFSFDCQKYRIIEYKWTAPINFILHIFKMNELFLKFKPFGVWLQSAHALYTKIDVAIVCLSVCLCVSVLKNCFDKSNLTLCVSVRIVLPLGFL